MTEVGWPNSGSSAHVQPDAGNDVYKSWGAELV